MTTETEIPEPINSLGLLLSIAERAANLPHFPATAAERFAEKMAAGRMAINTDTIDQLALLLRRDLLGKRKRVSGKRAQLRTLVDQAWEDVYVKGWPVPTGRLSLEDRALLRVAMAHHNRALAGKK